MTRLLVALPLAFPAGLLVGAVLHYLNLRRITPRGSF